MILLDEMIKNGQLTIEDQFEIQKIRQIAIQANTNTLIELIVQIFQLYMQYRRMLIYLLKTSNIKEKLINDNKF